MTLLTSTALAILGGIFAALLAFGGVRAAWRGFAGRRGTFAALCVLAAFCAILADKPTPVPSALLRWDRGLADNGSIATNDTVFIRGTYDPLMANDALHVDYRPKWITDSPDGWARAYDGAVGDLADGFTVTIPDATNMVVWIWSEYVEPAPTHTNGEYRIIYVGRIDGGAAESPRYVLPRTPIVASSEIIPVEYIESTGTQWIDTGIYHNYTNTVRFKIRMPTHSPSSAYLGAYADYQNEQTRTTRIIRQATSLRNVFIYHGAIAGFQGVRVDNVVGNDYIVEGYTTNTGGVLNGVSYRATASYGVTGTSTATLKLLISNSSITNAQTARVYYFKIDNQCDLIPVRVGTTGALFDKRGVGGMNGDGTARNDGLYFNRGTGDFVCGPDVHNGSAILSPPSLPPPAQSLFSTLATENLTE